MLNNAEEIATKIYENINESLEKNNLQEIFKNLSQIKEPIICSGVGGSATTAIFAKKVFEQKNGVLATFQELLEILQNNQENQPVFLISHSGKNHGIKKVIKNTSKSYLLANRKSKIGKEILLRYQESIPEKSFISLGDTIIPMSILLKYYDNDYKQKERYYDRYSLKDWNAIEVFKDYATSASAAFIESTSIEANLGPVIVHDKYSFCHGRTTTTHYNNNLIIYLISKENNLDKMLLKILKDQKKNIVVLNAEEQDFVISDYKLTLMALNLLIQMAKMKKIDLCNIKYAPFASKTYHNTLEDYE